MNSDLWYYISNFLDVANILTCLVINKETHNVFSKMKICKEHILLNNRSEFVELPDLKLLEYHIKHQVKKHNFNIQNACYYIKLCVNSNAMLNKQIRLFKKIINRIPQRDKKKYTSNIRLVTIDTLKKAISPAFVEILYIKNEKYTIHNDIMNYCHNYDILCWFIDLCMVDDNIYTLCKLLTSHYNHTALETILYFRPESCQEIIRFCDDRLWLDKNIKFREILYKHISQNNILLELYANKMLLYYCRYKTINDIKNTVLNNESLLSQLLVAHGIKESVYNDNGYNILVWLSEYMLIYTEIDIGIIFDHILSFDRLDMIIYWKNKYHIVLEKYYKNIHDAILKWHLSYKKSFDFILEYFDPNRLLRIIGEKWCDIISYDKYNGTNQIYPSDTIKYSDHVIKTFYDNLDFDKITKDVHIYVIHYFLFFDDCFVLNKYIAYQQDANKKIAILIKLLSFVNDYNKNKTCIQEIARMLVQCYD
jgi:hypothetical protein